MLNDKGTLEQVAATAAILGLEQYVVEKDLYVTHAIALMSKIDNPYFQIIFQGGTCLAKAHRIIQRMSEDCDFRLSTKPGASFPSKEAKRKALREFRHNIVEALQKGEFEIAGEELRIRNEGQFMSVRARYSAEFIPAKTLKPFLALEFFLGTVKLTTHKKDVTTLVQQTLGDAVNHASVNINCISIEETAAEKWVALTRRVATSTHNKRYRDPNLVRHMYDLYKINHQGYFNDDMQRIVADIIETDRQQFKNHNEAYFLNPAAEIERALVELNESNFWKDHWDSFMDAMVFDSNTPTYNDAMLNLSSLRLNMLKTTEIV